MTEFVEIAEYQLQKVLDLNAYITDTFAKLKRQYCEPSSSAYDEFIRFFTEFADSCALCVKQQYEAEQRAAKQKVVVDAKKFIQATNQSHKETPATPAKKDDGQTEGLMDSLLSSFINSGPKRRK